MKSLRFYCFIFSVCLSMALSMGYAKGVKITLKDNTAKFTDISDVAKITFLNGNFVVNKLSGDAVSTPITDIYNVTFGESSGISDALVDGSKIAMFPNPCVSSFWVRGIIEATHIDIYSIEGKLVKSLSVAAGDEISVSDFAPGVYIVKLAGETFKLMKK